MEGGHTRVNQELGAKATVVTPWGAPKPTGALPQMERDHWTLAVSPRTRREQKRQARRRDWHRRREMTTRQRAVHPDGRNPSVRCPTERRSTGGWPDGQLPAGGHPNGQASRIEWGRSASPKRQRQSVGSPGGRLVQPPQPGRLSAGCPVGQKVSAGCPVGQNVSTRCPVGQKVSVGCPVGQLPTNCPVGPKVSAGCPVGQKVSAGCPVGQNVSTRCPVGQKVSAGCPVGQNVSTRCPVGQKVSVGCPVGQLPTNCPVGQKASARCPDGQLHAGCPVGQQASARCPDGQLPVGCPVGQNVSTRCPVGQEVSAGCPVGQNVSAGCPVGQKVSAGCPVGQNVSTRCPVGQKVSVGCPVGQLPTNCPVGQKVSVGCPVGQLHAGCPVGQKLSTRCPVGQDVSTRCPVGQKVSAGCPVGQKASTSCPDGHHRRVQRPNGQTQVGWCPEGQLSASCPVGQKVSTTGTCGRKVSTSCPDGQPLVARRSTGPLLPTWAHLPARVGVPIGTGGSGSSSSSSSESGSYTSNGPRNQGWTVRMMQGEEQRQDSSSDQSAGDRRGNSPQRDKNPPGHDRRVMAMAGHHASLVRAAIPVDRPAGNGSQTLPAGWWEILPPNETWSHSPDHGSDSSASRTAPRPGAGHSQARAHHSARPDDTGTQTDYRHSFGSLPALLPRTDSTWPTVIRHWGDPIGQQPRPTGETPTSGTRSGVASGVGSRGPSDSPGRSTGMSVYQDCTDVANGLEWDDVSIRTAGRPWFESDEAWTRVPPPSPYRDGYQRAGQHRPHPGQNPSDLIYPADELGFYQSVINDEQTRAEMLLAAPPAGNNGRTLRPSPQQLDPWGIEDDLNSEAALSSYIRLEEYLASSGARNCREGVHQAGGLHQNSFSQPRGVLESEYREELDREPCLLTTRPPVPHPYEERPWIQESRLESAVGAGRIVDRRRKSPPAQIHVEETRPGEVRRPRELRTGHVTTRPDQPNPELPGHRGEQEFRPRSVTFSEAVNSWSEEQPHSHYEHRTQPPSGESERLIERGRVRTSTAANQTPIHPTPLWSSTQVRGPRNVDRLSPRSVEVSGFLGSHPKGPCSTRSDMQPLDHHELRWQSAALVEAANGAARARRAGVGLQRSRGEARYDFNVHAQPSPVVDHETPHHEYTSRHHYQAGQTSRGHHRRPVDDEGYQAEMTWNQPAMAPRSAGRQLPPLPLRVKPEPRNSVRLTEAPPETFRGEMSPRMNHFPRGMRPACYPSDKVVDQSQPGSRYLAKPKPEYPCSSGDERRNVDLDRLLPHGARLGAADKGASDSRRHRRQDGAVPTGKNEREQTNRIPSQPQRQRRVKGRNPGDSPSSPDSSGEDGGRPPNRQSGTNLPKKGDKKKGRKPSGSSPDPSDGNSSDGSELF